MKSKRFMMGALMVLMSSFVNNNRANAMNNEDLYRNELLRQCQMLEADPVIGE